MRNLFVSFFLHQLEPNRKQMSSEAYQTKKRMRLLLHMEVKTVDLIIRRKGQRELKRTEGALA